MKNFVGRGKVASYGVECNVCNMRSKDRLDDWEVVKEVFIFLICLSMKPFDLGYKGDEVMWSMARDDKNCEKGSDEKGGPLSEKKCLGVPNWEKRSCKWLIILSVVLE